MKRAFVIRLTEDSDPAKGRFVGCAEEVESGREIRFGTLEEFLAFVQASLSRNPVTAAEPDQSS